MCSKEGMKRMQTKKLLRTHIHLVRTVFTKGGDGMLK